MSDDTPGFYDIVSWRGLIEKCRYELSQLTRPRKALPSDSYTLFNLVLTLNHLFDWVVLDKSIERDVRIECVKRFNPYERPKPDATLDEVRRFARTITGDYPIYKHFVTKNLADFPPPCREQWLARKVANRLKHVKVAPKVEKVESAIFWQNQWMDTTWFVVDDIEGRSVELVGQCQLLLGMWESFVGRRNL